MPTKRLKDLEVNELYSITAIEKVKAKFDSKIVLELDHDFDVFMPEKVTDFLYEHEKEFDDLEKIIGASKAALKFLGGCSVEFVKRKKKNSLTA